MRPLLTALLGSALLWPAALHLYGQRWGQQVEGIAQDLGRVTAPAPALETPPQVLPEPQLLAPGDPELAEPEAAPEPQRQARRPAKRSKRPQAKASSVAAKTPTKGIRVSARTVLQLAKARAIPQGSYQGPAAGQPGGMRLSGVSGMGVGLSDGDVLSHVAGVPATSRSAVVTAVMQARAQKAKALSATFWRNGEPWRLVVEMPYLKRRSAVNSAVANAPRAQQVPSAPN